jgi:CheY-like chemotaxis protein
VLALVERDQADDPVQVILMDASMDVMDGLEATRIIRQRQDPKRFVPWIIGQTAHVSDAFRRECTEAGMVRPRDTWCDRRRALWTVSVFTHFLSILLLVFQDAFLAKPIKLELLSQRLLEAYDAVSQRQPPTADAGQPPAPASS